MCTKLIRPLCSSSELIEVLREPVAAVDVNYYHATFERLLDRDMEDILGVDARRPINIIYDDYNRPLYVLTGRGKKTEMHDIYTRIEELYK